MGGIVAGVAVSYALSWISYKYFTEEPEKPPVDESTPTTSSRGAPIPRVMGTRRVGPVIGWVGGRRVEDVKQEQGGKGGGGKGDDVVVGYKYHEQAVHYLCVGPADALHAVYVGEADILGGTITRDTHPNGSTVSTDKGSFRIYWGNCFDIATDSLADTIGIGSGFPGVCHIVWDEYHLGETTAWPPIEYVVTYEPAQCFLGVDEWIDDVGANPACALWELLTADRPIGCAIDPTLLSRASFTAAATTLDGEGLGINVVATDLTVVDQVDRILREIGGGLVQVGAQLHLVLRRSGDTAYALDDDIASATPPEIVVDCHKSTAEQTVYRYADSAQRYKQIDVATADDAAAQYRAVRVTTDEIHCLTAADLVVPLTDRLGLERAVGAHTFRLRAGRNAADLMPGQPITWSEIGRARIVSITHDPAAGVVDLTCARDVYDPAASSTWSPSTGAGTLSTGQTLTADTAVTLAELPPAWGATVPGLVPLRIRSSSAALTADVLVSGDGGTSYASAGRVTNLAVGGTLDSAIAADAPWIIETGPTITVDSLAADAAMLLDLSGSLERWRGGDQLAYIAGEWFFVRGVTQLSATSWRLTGLMRARLGTTRLPHAAGERICILPRAAVTAVYPSVATPGATVHVKVVPASPTASLDASAVTAQTIDMVGRSVTPPPVGDPRATGADGLRGLFSSGDDLVIAWQTRVANGHGRAADEQGAGIAIADDDPTADGPTVVEIIDVTDASVVRTVTVAAGTESLTYTAAQITADFGAAPAHIAAVISPTAGGPLGPASWVLASSTGRRARVLTTTAGAVLTTPAGALLIATES